MASRPEPDPSTGPAHGHGPGPGPGGRPGTGDLPASTEEWEQLRRSVAMLSPGAWALRREVALAALGLLISHLRRAETPGE